LSHETASQASSIALVGADKPFLDAIVAAFQPVAALKVNVINEGIVRAASRPELDKSVLVVVDIDSSKPENFVALQSLVTRLGTAVPVVVLVDSFDDALGRWFLQIRVADFLRKPVEPKEVLQACLRVLQATARVPEVQGQVLCFLPAAGGVGNTTLAIETAMLLLHEARDAANSTCLVDLDLRAGACADYLDLESRLDLGEIGPFPERLDAQLLEVMLSRHASGLTLLSARGRPVDRQAIDPAVVLRLLDLVSSRFANVVVDLPRAWEPWTDHVLVGSSRVYVVTDMTVPGLRLARRLASDLSGRYPELKPRVIVNRAEPRKIFGTGLRRADAERALDGFFEGSVTNNYVLVREAIDRGLPLESVKRGSNVSQDLKQILLAANKPASPS
jgi:pilus assembly protein CpaE